MDAVFRRLPPLLPMDAGICEHFPEPATPFQHLLENRAATHGRPAVELRRVVGACDRSLGRHRRVFHSAGNRSLESDRWRAGGAPLLDTERTGAAPLNK